MGGVGRPQAGRKDIHWLAPPSYPEGLSLERRRRGGIPGGRRPNAPYGTSAGMRLIPTCGAKLHPCKETLRGIRRAVRLARDPQPK